MTKSKIWRHYWNSKRKKPAGHANLLGGGGKYPFFTCSLETKKSFTYSFDCLAILVASGGSKFHAKIYDGKFEASTDAFVAKLKNSQHSYLILEFLNKLTLTKLNLLIQASTFLKHLSPEQLKNIEILIPDKETLEKFNIICETIQTKIEKLTKKIKK